MNQAIIVGSSQMLAQDMEFRKGAFDRLKGYLQDASQILGRVNLATAEGKAFDYLQEGLICSHIEAEVSLEESSVLLNQGKHEVHVRVVTSTSLSPEVRFQIHRMLAGVNLRYGTNIRVEFVNRQ